MSLGGVGVHTVSDFLVVIAQGELVAKELQQASKALKNELKDERAKFRRATHNSQFNFYVFNI